MTHADDVLSARPRRITRRSQAATDTETMTGQVRLQRALTGIVDRSHSRHDMISCRGTRACKADGTAPHWQTFQAAQPAYNSPEQTLFKKLKFNYYTYPQLLYLL